MKTLGLEMSQDAERINSENEDYTSTDKGVFWTLKNR